MEYACIVADPPWMVNRLESPGSKGFGTQQGILRSVALEYPTMSVEEISALEIPAARDAHLYIWTINAYVEVTYGIARAWGFEPSTLLSWIKAPMGLGLGGTFCNTTEFILFCRRGTLKAKKRVDRTWWGWPRGAHSAKPEHFQNIVESVSPGPYLEMFARRQRPGWDVWGNQVKCDVEITAK
jgi:N6-adenosine-specific RNA methylase IME4